MLRHEWMEKNAILEFDWIEFNDGSEWVALWI